MSSISAVDIWYRLSSTTIDDGYFVCWTKIVLNDLLQWCWWLYDGDSFKILAVESHIYEFVSVTNISKLSPTLTVIDIRHEHLCSWIVQPEWPIWLSKPTQIQFTSRSCLNIKTVLINQCILSWVRSLFLKMH